jgi:hypothetical protein
MSGDLKMVEFSTQKCNTTSCHSEVLSMYVYKRKQKHPKSYNAGTEGNCACIASKLMKDAKKSKQQLLLIFTVLSVSFLSEGCKL